MRTASVMAAPKRLYATINMIGSPRPNQRVPGNQWPAAMSGWATVTRLSGGNAKAARAPIVETGR
jgi:hypothetical protein